MVEEKKFDWKAEHRQQPTNYVQSICSISSWLYRAVGELHSAVGLSLWRARRSGTHHRLSFVICLSVLMTLKFKCILKTLTLFARYWCIRLNSTDKHAWYCAI